MTSHRRTTHRIADHPWACAVRRRTDHALVRLAVRLDDERGDIPGWVMVTVMTAMLVAAIGTLAEAEFKSLLSAALDKVRG